MGVFTEEELWQRELIRKELDDPKKYKRKNFGNRLAKWTLILLLFNGLCIALGQLAG